MTVEIVEATLPADYGVIAGIHDELFPNDPTTPEVMQRTYENPPKKCRRAIFLACLEGQTVGYASYRQEAWAYDRHKFAVEVRVLPAYQRRGIGAALHDHLLAALAPYKPRELTAYVREVYGESVRFAEKRGYRELDKDWESHLDPVTVDLARFNGAEGRVAAQGIVIKTLAELQSADPAYRRKIYELDWEASQDIPIAVQLTKPSFAQYEQDVFENPALCPDSFFVAVDGERYAGLTSLRPSPGKSGELKTGFTGVSRAYRRRGIALALKLRAIAYAQGQGTRLIRTWNARDNAPMLAINAQLGFVRQPGWIVYRKEIGE